MLLGFLSRTTTYLKAAEKDGIKIMKDTFINISKIVLFFLLVNKTALINLK